MKYNIKAKNIDTYELVFDILKSYNIKISTESYKRRTISVDNLSDDIQHHLIDIGCFISFDERDE